MGKTSSAVKDRYNAKAYDALTLRVPKGYKATIQSYADAAGQSLNAYIKESIDTRINRENAPQSGAFMPGMEPQEASETAEGHADDPERVKPEGDDIIPLKSIQPNDWKSAKEKTTVIKH